MKLPRGYTLQWSGQCEFMERAKSRMQVGVLARLAIVFHFLYFSFRTVPEMLLVLPAIYSIWKERSTAEARGASEVGRSREPLAPFGVGPSLPAEPLGSLPA